jgi:rhodanese-related sulfurtransferase
VAAIDRDELMVWLADDARTTYRFDVRTPEEFEEGHLEAFRSAPGGQLVQETDVFAPVRGGRMVLADHDGVRAQMTGSWLAQMGWEVCVLAVKPAGTRLVRSAAAAPAEQGSARRSGAYRRPYEGTGNPRSAMEAYLNWELGLVAQLERDGTHHFHVI